MKNNRLLIKTVAFFVAINTAYYWEAMLGTWAMAVTLVLFITFIALWVGLLYQIFLSAKEKFRSKARLTLITVMTLVLGLTVYKPFGLISFDHPNKNDFLIAQREGAANCMITFKLKANNKFSERSVCFGVTEVKGSYYLKGDTIFFKEVEPGRHEREYYKFAIIKKPDVSDKKYFSELIRYKSYSDTTGNKLWISKNELLK